ncbi:hypothetical protein RND71_000297 [Anisodus tanguticus]|uniref:Uncharacterized protein n=1 Tax=Anisodus tanguticus TaxID=243964 RepID=A0AAE1SY34_9SOLA|nr:hypothetical protein RND71_000297 [Anisodus tanguticus]
MEESYRWSSPDNCPNELTRSNSGASSSKDTLLQSGNATTDKHMGWTNEKHNTFLDCLEASFVKQLHRSMALRAGSVELNKSCSNSSEKLSAHVNKASEQLPFLHNGCWKKIKKTVRKPPVVYIAADFHDCLKYLRSDGYHHVLDRQTSCELHCKGKRTRDKRRSCGHETRSHSIHSKPAELQKTVCGLAGKHFDKFVLKLFLI